MDEGDPTFGQLRAGGAVAVARSVTRVVPVPAGQLFDPSAQIVDGSSETESESGAAVVNPWDASTSGPGLLAPVLPDPTLTRAASPPAPRRGATARGRWSWGGGSPGLPNRPAGATSPRWGIGAPLHGASCRLLRRGVWPPARVAFGHLHHLLGAIRGWTGPQVGWPTRGRPNAGRVRRTPGRFPSETEVIPSTTFAARWTPSRCSRSSLSSGTPTTVTNGGGCWARSAWRTPSSSAPMAPITVRRSTRGIDIFRRSFPKSRTSHGKPDSHHGYLRFRWTTEWNDGRPATQGIDFGSLAKDGRLARLVSFDHPAPPVGV